MTTLQQIDLSDHDAFLERVPHEWFATLRGARAGGLHSWREPWPERPHVKEEESV
jgi:hypothetical protein